MKKIRIYPYKGYSNSAKELKKSLSDEFNVLRIKENGSKYKQRSTHLVINWGNTKKPHWLNGGFMLNNYLAVNKAVNKIETFKALQNANVPTVEWTEDKEVAQEWRVSGETVFERHIINGSQGRGIVIKGTAENISNASLYTKLIPKAREYRVHVFNGKVIDIQQKKRRRLEDGEEIQDGLIKNMANGWVFCRDDITLPPDQIYEVAINAIKALGLDFGAVDILSKDGNVYVLEVNTACGLTGTTLLNYVNAIKEYATG